MKLSSEFSNWLKYGQHLALSAEYKRAKRAFDRRLEDDPYDYGALYGAGRALYVTGEYGKALPYLEAAFRLSPIGDATEYYNAVCEKLGVEREEA